MHWEPWVPLRTVTQGCVEKLCVWVIFPAEILLAVRMWSVWIIYNRGVVWVTNVHEKINS